MIRRSGNPTYENDRLWAGIYVADGMFFCQMQVEREKLREAADEQGWVFLTELLHDEDEPFLVFLARIDTIMERYAYLYGHLLFPVRLQSWECYRRLGLPRMMGFSLS